MIATSDLRRAMHEIADRKGNFTLFALFMRADAPFARADAPGTWDLVVSAPWLEGSKLKAIRELVDLLAKTIGSKSVQEFSRVEAVPVNDPTIQLILRSVPVEDGERHIQSTDLLGMRIEKGIIFRAWQPGRKKPARKEPRPVTAGSLRGRG